MFLQMYFQLQTNTATDWMFVPSYPRPKFMCLNPNP